MWFCRTCLREQGDFRSPRATSAQGDGQQQAVVSSSPWGCEPVRGGQPAWDTPRFIQVPASPREQGEALTRLAMAALDLQPSKLTSAEGAV